MVALPLIVVAAVKLGPQSDPAGGGGQDSNFGSGNFNLIGLATSSPLNFTVVMLLFGSGFLLTTVFSLFHGDTVASEASWSSLRYLLAAPVPRRRLVFIKAAVAMTLSWLSLAILVLSSIVIGRIAFGDGEFVTPLGLTFGFTDGLLRVLGVAVYIGFTLLFAAGIALLMSVSTDIPLGAVGTAVMVAIISQILDALEALGDLRQWLPSHYARSWLALLDDPIAWDDMIRGGATAVIIFCICFVAAVLKFDRKDIVS
jgi:ABC-2 type transport system permease protein